MSITTETGFYRAADVLLSKGITASSVLQGGEAFRDASFDALKKRSKREQEFAERRRASMYNNRQKAKMEREYQEFYQKHQQTLFSEQQDREEA